MFSICRVLYLLGKTGHNSSELGKKAAQRSEQGTRQDSGRTAKSDRWLERASEGVGRRKWVGSGLSSLEGTSRADGSLGRERIQNTHGGILQGPLSPKSCVCICAVNRAGTVRMKWRGRQGHIPRGFMYCMVSFTFILESLKNEGEVVPTGGSKTKDQRSIMEDATEDLAGEACLFMRRLMH